MAKYDVYPNPNGLGYLIDVQADLLENLNSRIVVPLFPVNEAPKPAKRINPLFDIDGEQVIMLTQYLASVPLSLLKTPVRNLSEEFSDITNALDMVFQGF